MGGQTREIKRRIKSVTSTSKITKTMELVSATKMRKAVKAVLETRAYSQAAWEIITSLADRVDRNSHPLLKQRDKIKKVGLILIASDRGLCGTFNRDVVETMAEYVRWHNKEVVDVEAEVFLLGKRGRDIMFKHGHQIIAEFAKVDVTTRISEVTPLAQAALSDYHAGKYDKIVIAYTDYYSAISQKTRIKQLLPLVRDDQQLGYVAADEEKRRKVQEHQPLPETAEYLFEPNPDVVLDQMLLRLIELQIYQALLESNASEHSARMLAMRNATDNASDYIEDLTLTFNQARQAAITSEIAEISAGRAALE
ncbi:MAG: ATP synthase F1 subunit gamma [Patescibacteria group bacterium]